MSWLSGWSKRIKLDIDYTNKIGASVTHFPVTIFLKSGNGDTEKVFDEVGANSKKIAVTKADGTTELKVEIEQWDSTNKVGVLHTSLSGWEINEDCSIFIYYDNSHDDNPNVGDIGSDAGKAVWNSGFAGVWHLKDDTTSTTKDSTSNGNNGTKIAANEPIEVDGRVGKAQSFDGSNDYINLFKFHQQPQTKEAIIKVTDFGSEERQVVASCNARARINTVADGGIGGGAYDGDWNANYNKTGYSTNTWYYVAVTIPSSGNDLKVYVDGGEVFSATISTVSFYGNYPETIGCYRDSSGIPHYFFYGLVDEVRLSNVARSAAWIKGTYNSTNDSLLTYGDQEVAGLPITIDNVQVKSITIDGQEVKGLTIDGETIF